MWPQKKQYAISYQLMTSTGAEDERRRRRRKKKKSGRELWLFRSCGALPFVQCMSFSPRAGASRWRSFVAYARHSISLLLSRPFFFQQFVSLDSCNTDDFCTGLKNTWQPGNKQSKLIRNSFLLNVVSNYLLTWLFPTVFPLGLTRLRWLACVDQHHEGIVLFSFPLLFFCCCYSY